MEYFDCLRRNTHCMSREHFLIVSPHNIIIIVIYGVISGDFH
jgi:hypothetical protein